MRPICDASRGVSHEHSARVATPWPCVCNIPLRSRLVNAKFNKVPAYRRRATPCGWSCRSSFRPLIVRKIYLPTNHKFSSLNVVPAFPSVSTAVNGGRGPVDAIHFQISSPITAHGVHVSLSASGMSCLFASVSRTTGNRVKFFPEWMMPRCVQDGSQPPWPSHMRALRGWEKWLPWRM